MAATVPPPPTSVPQQVPLEGDPDEVGVVLLLKSSGPDSSAAKVVPANNHHSRPSGRNKRRWFGWLFRQQPPQHRNSSGDSAAVNSSNAHPKDQNNYVSVSLTPPDEQPEGTTTTPCGRKKWRPREKWLLLFLMIATVACAALLAMSLVSFFRQGQGTTTMNPRYQGGFRELGPFFERFFFISAGPARSLIGSR